MAEGTSRLSQWILSIVAIIVWTNIGCTQAQTYPSHTTTIVVPYSPGGIVDVIARLIADRLRITLGQPVIVDNKAGAGGNIGTSAVSNAAPDGYTLLLGSPSHTINPSLYPNLTWDPIRSFEPIIMIGVVPNVLVLHPSVQANTLAEFIALAKAKPGEFSYASAGAGSSNHLTVELLKSRTGIDMVHVPYKGQPDAIRDLLADRVQFMATSIALVQQYIQSGQLRALAITNTERATLLPDVPTADEAGLPDFDVVAWFGLFAPAKIAPDIVQRLNHDLRQILAKPEILSRLETIGLTIRAGTAEDLRRFVAKDRDRWADSIKKAHIRID
ncbi:tripartite tricarboxylate transporter substrate binding protein [Bradyrhizobium mercantei]|uniref:tripartite tricarboxylate transporter substrate binding protein n=1 Tax=Bradyrhizobium mercantei TaxID=1904807 RepID=UPI000977F050|nr:tripartite tricarboxylate transporter substrate binding protein [Bradyrhizobium mercantei]